MREEFYVQEIEKIARSFDARRKKQYWQMLKKMYGGNDRAIEMVKELGSDISHGSKAKYLDAIKKEGLKYGERAAAGAGVYFGDKAQALEYATADGSKGFLATFKKPSQFKKTDKLLYPHANTYRDNIWYYNLDNQKKMFTTRNKHSWYNNNMHIEEFKKGINPKLFNFETVK